MAPAQSKSQCNTQPSVAQRRVIYQARRGLKELDYYFAPYVKAHYLCADAKEQACFAQLLTYEDPDLLNFFTNLATPTDPNVAQLVNKIKQLRHANGS